MAVVVAMAGYNSQEVVLACIVPAVDKAVVDSVDYRVVDLGVDNPVVVDFEAGSLAVSAAYNPVVDVALVVPVVDCEDDYFSGADVAGDFAGS